MMTSVLFLNILQQSKTTVYFRSQEDESEMNKSKAKKALKTRGSY